MKIFTPVLLFLIVLSQNTFAQLYPCGTDEFMQREALEDPAATQRHLDFIKENLARIESAATAKTENATYTIPVVFHVVHNNGSENISDAQIHDALRIVNEDFQMKAPDLGLVQPAFKNIIGNANMNFVLAKVDPNGNCTNGITRTISSQTFNAFEGIKDVVYWDESKYLNIWSVGNVAGGQGGYTTLPHSSKKQGIVIRNSAIGSIGTSPGTNFAARTLTHEIGHYFGLNHVWGWSDYLKQDACNGDDLVGDTPNTIGSSIGSCNLQQMSCGSLDNVENHMNYSGCNKMFTKGQVDYMHGTLQSTQGSRKNLWSAANLAATGTGGGFAGDICLPDADFTFNNNVGCEGMMVDFNGLSTYSGTNPNLTWSWQFPGGSPSSSTLQNPSITYSSSGSYNVSLTVTNSSGNVTENKTQVIKVSALNTIKPIPFSEGFEAQFPPADWNINNFDGELTWEKSTTAKTGTGSAKMYNWDYENGNGEVDELILPAVDFVGVSQMTFDLAHTLYSAVGAGYSDTLEVLVSVDCGSSFTSVYKKYDAALNTTATTEDDFKPTTGQWRSETINLASFAGNNSGIIKFRHTTDFENNLYLDNVNITGTATGLATPEDKTNFRLYPNPSNGIVYTSIKDKDAASLAVYNSIGSVVFQQFIAGSGNRLDLSNLEAGIYFLQVTTSSGNLSTKRLVLE